MNRFYVKDVVSELNGKKILLQGFVHEVRDLSKIKFVLLRDWTGVVQLVAREKDTQPELFDKLGKLSAETVISVEGIVQLSNVAKKGVEVLIEKMEILNSSEKLPITVQEKGITTDLSKRLDYRTIDLRKPRNTMIFKIQSAILEGMVNYLENDAFVQVFTPCIIGTPSESGSEVFPVVYFNSEAFLRQDPQLHRQLAIAGGIERIYDIGPSWRAEQSHTTKHLCEHRTCAVELAFIKDETDTMRVEENLVVSALKQVNKKYKDQLRELGVQLKVPETPFPELRFPKIYDILQSMGKKIEYGDDIDTESDKLLWEHVQKKYGTEFYFFNRFPSKLKPFYVMQVDDEPEWARSVDLYFKGLELSSGGQREHRYDVLMKQVTDKGMNPKSVEWFTNFFRYGVPPHGGFALGIERITQNLLNLENIREAVLFPRDPERLEP